MGRMTALAYVGIPHPALIPSEPNPNAWLYAAAFLIVLPAVFAAYLYWMRPERR